MDEDRGDTAVLLSLLPQLTNASAARAEIIDSHDSGSGVRTEI